MPLREALVDVDPYRPQPPMAVLKAQRLATTAVGAEFPTGSMAASTRNGASTRHDGG